MTDTTTNIIASESFILTYESGKQKKAQLDLIPSSSFTYGNRTGMLMQIEGEQEQFFDTRYEKGCNSPEAFHEWSLAFLRDRIRPTIKIERA